MLSCKLAGWLAGWLTLRATGYTSRERTKGCKESPGTRTLHGNQPHPVMCGALSATASSCGSVEGRNSTTTRAGSAAAVGVSKSPPGRARLPTGEGEIAVSLWAWPRSGCLLELLSGLRRAFDTFFFFLSMIGEDVESFPPALLGIEDHASGSLGARDCRTTRTGGAAEGLARLHEPAHADSVRGSREALGREGRAAKRGFVPRSRSPWKQY